MNSSSKTKHGFKFLSPWRIQQAKNFLVEISCRLGMRHLCLGRLLDGKPIKRVLFLCSGNICRSPYAEHRLRELMEGHPELTISSSGLDTNPGKPAYKAAMLIARNRGVDLSNHRTRTFDLSEALSADIIFIMDAHHVGIIKCNYPEILSKTVLLGAYGREYGTPFVIRDPFGLAEDVYEKVFSQIDLALQNFVDRLDSTKI